MFGISKSNIRVISPFVGGAFGSVLRAWPHVTLAALAARHVGRPVRVELTRRQTFSSVGFRPYTEQDVALGADRDGRLVTMIHEARSQTSIYEEYAEFTLEPTRSVYACPNLRTHYELTALNTNTPCPMRAAGHVTGLLGLELAMDELAEALQMDPIELRIRNNAERDQAKDLPWSNKELLACYRIGKERFGWSRRAPRPRAMRDGRWLLAMAWRPRSTRRIAHPRPRRSSVRQWNGAGAQRGKRHGSGNLHRHDAACGRHAWAADRVSAF